MAIIATFTLKKIGFFLMDNWKPVTVILVTLFIGYQIYSYANAGYKEAEVQKEARATRDTEIINEGERETKKKTEKADKSKEKLDKGLKQDSKEFETTQSEIDKKFCEQFPEDSTCKK